MIFLAKSIIYALIFIFIFNNIWNYFNLTDIQIIIFSVLLTWIFWFIISKLLTTLSFVIIWLILINIFSYFINWNILWTNYIQEKIIQVANNIKDFKNSN